MLTIIHGDNISESRKYFITLREQQPNSQIFDGEKVTLTDLAQIFDGGELFSDSKTVFIEQFFSRRKKSQEKDSLIASLQKYSLENDFFIWENKELERSVLNLFKTASIKSFKLPQTLFLFVDSIKPGNGKQLISLFHQTLAATEVEMIFFMLVRQVRLLLAFSSNVTPAQAGIQSNMDSRVKPEDDKKNSIDELKRLAPWQTGKLQTQASQFTPDKLKSLYSKLFNLEYGQKTGNLSSPLASSIDFLLLEI